MESLFAFSSSSSSSSPLLRFRIRVFFLSHLNPPKSQKPLFSPVSILLRLLFLFLLNINSSASLVPDSYTKYCNHIVPSSPLDSNPSTDLKLFKSLIFHPSYFIGGDPFFKQPLKPFNDFEKRLFFTPSSVQRTLTYGVYEVRAVLRLRDGERHPHYGLHNRRLRNLYHGGATVFPLEGRRAISLYGFWSESSGKLCMVGSGKPFKRYTGETPNLNVILKFNYPVNSTVLNSFVNGTLESFPRRFSSDYFEPISILGLSRSSDYEYLLVGKEDENVCVGGHDGDGLSLSNYSQGACSVFRDHMDRFELEYGENCNDVDCNPLGGDVGFLPKYMHFYSIRCTDKQKMLMLLSFPNTSSSVSPFPFHPNITFVAEGMWNEKKNQLCAVACRILNFSKSSLVASIGDCSIKFNLRFPGTLSLRNRGTVVGKIWSNKSVDESGYFSRIRFQGYWKLYTALLNLKYEYTEIDTAKRSCSVRKTSRSKGKTYPDGLSSDMRYYMSVRDSKGQVARGYSSPLFVGDSIYDHLSYGDNFVLPVVRQRGYAVQLNDHGDLLNISYKLTFKPPVGFKFEDDIAPPEEVELSAEGVYDRDTGFLCMIGCRQLSLADKKINNNESMDCRIKVSVQFPPLNAKVSEYVKGTIESTRLTTDPLYFKPLQLSSNSIYKSQAAASIWRMDLEIAMVLVSNTLACVFVGLQLLYVRKHPHVLPSISAVMLLVLTLGHMVPLLLNFKALFGANPSEQNVIFGIGGWLEVNEVIVRMVTMIVFLLELGLLHFTWSARQREERHQGLWVSEKKVLYVTLPLYVGGAVIAWYAHQWKNSYQNSLRPLKLSRHRLPLGRHPYLRYSVWEDLKSYAGLLLDGFLFPQILFNVFSNSEGETLTCPFYVGTTIVRLLPHAYDLYRAHSSTMYLDLSYIYANHRMDFYSTAWDIIIPCGGILLAVVIYLQQRFCGHCILPKRFRSSVVYEKVLSVGDVEL